MGTSHSVSNEYVDRHLNKCRKKIKVPINGNIQQNN